MFQVTGPPVSHVLWNNPDGRTIFWNVNADGSHDRRQLPGLQR